MAHHREILTPETLNHVMDNFPISLQSAIETNLRRYDRFLAHDPGDDPKRVMAHHQAGKNAVTHMTALVKLMQLFDKIRPEKKTDSDLDALLLRARHVLSSGSGHDAEDQL